jgi:hypothetical protein
LEIFPYFEFSQLLLMPQHFTLSILLVFLDFSILCPTEKFNKYYTLGR